LKGKAGYNEGKGGKEGEKSRKRKKDGMVYGVIPLLLFADPLGRAGDGDVRHPGSYLSLEQRALSVNLDEAPHPATGVGGSNS
jgi:hypothetical protein